MRREQLDRAQQINGRIEQLLAGKYPSDTKTTLVLAYLNLALDHHSSIVLLMRSEMYGSALALVRLVFEAMIRAHWVLGCASGDQADEIARSDDFKFPNMDIMTKAVDTAFGDPSETKLTFFQKIKTQAWAAMNSYTHSGLLQLARQFQGDLVEANYSQEALEVGLGASTASLLLLGVMVARGSSRSAAAGELEALFGQ